MTTERLGQPSLLWSLVLAFRPKTLTAALVPCLAGSALALSFYHKFDGSVLWLSLLASFCIQIGTNLVNDAMDFKKGADTAERMGPQRITQAGLLSPSVVLAIGSLFFAIAILAGWPLVMKGGAPILYVGLASVLMGYAYTSGPWPLAYVGLGDLFVVLFFGLAAVMGSVYLHTGIFSVPAFVMGLQIGLHCAVLIAINNLRDHQGDAKVGKKTMAVRLGVQGARTEISFLIAAPYALNLFWLSNGKWVASLLPLLSLPLALKIARNVWRNSPGPVYNKFLAQSAGLHLIFGLLLALGLLL